MNLLLDLAFVADLSIWPIGRTSVRDHLGSSANPYNPHSLSSTPSQLAKYGVINVKEAAVFWCPSMVQSRDSGANGLSVTLHDHHPRATRASRRYCFVS